MLQEYYDLLGPRFILLLAIPAWIGLIYTVCYAAVRGVEWFSRKKGGD
jgi:hypothetical protein